MSAWFVYTYIHWSIYIYIYILRIVVTSYTYSVSCYRDSLPEACSPHHVCAVSDQNSRETVGEADPALAEVALREAHVRVDTRLHHQAGVAHGRPLQPVRKEYHLINNNKKGQARQATSSGGRGGGGQNWSRGVSLRKACIQTEDGKYNVLRIIQQKTQKLTGAKRHPITFPECSSTLHSTMKTRRGRDSCGICFAWHNVLYPRNIVFFVAEISVTPKRS